MACQFITEICNGITPFWDAIILTIFVHFWVKIAFAHRMHACDLNAIFMGTKLYLIVDAQRQDKCERISMGKPSMMTSEFLLFYLQAC